ncbi:MAG TPA: hypothetical protein VHL98_17690 [Microvirga sp.]|jgi:hypothetical protein|nr:hypothetical protein [Microvirga sp.]
MAKKAKSKKAHKSVAGVKLPKAMRKSSVLGSLFTSELGREILADALLAAAGAAAAALTRTRPARAAGAAIADAGSDAAASAGTAATATGDLVQTAAGAVAGVVTEAARTFLPPSLLGEEAKPRYVNKASNTDSAKRSGKAGKGTGKKRSKKGA